MEKTAHAATVLRITQKEVAMKMAKPLAVAVITALMALFVTSCDVERDVDSVNGVCEAHLRIQVDTWTDTTIRCNGWSKSFTRPAEVKGACATPGVVFTVEIGGPATFSIFSQETGEPFPVSFTLPDGTVAQGHTITVNTPGTVTITVP